jgi:light-independent protochlorophyllide reductase subunit B
VLSTVANEPPAVVDAAPAVPVAHAGTPGPSTEAIVVAAAAAPAGPAPWTADAEKELKKIPFFVRGKARRNTEAYAGELGLTRITVETLYDAKAHFSR